MGLFSLNLSGSLGNEAIIVTKDEDVYSLGANVAGCLGLNDQASSLVPRKVENLCGLGIRGT